jgi:hypothetical protein
MSDLLTPKPTARMHTKEIQVLTNQLHITPPTEWSALLRNYSIWRYQLSEPQNRFRRFADARFYSRFTNDYKNKFDQPFYFFTFDEPYASLYTLLPAGEIPRPWLYTFGKPGEVQPEEIAAETVAPDEVRPHVLLKLMLALCFYENGTNDKDRRVCQSRFYLRVKSQKNGKTLTAVEVQPVVDEQPLACTLTLKVEANTFERIEPAKAAGYAHLGAFYELFESQGHTYLRQLRPNQVAGFTRELYQQRTFMGKRTQADWHHNGSAKHPEQYRQSRSYQVRHVQVRLQSFLRRYDFQVMLGEEPMRRQKATKQVLPLHRLPVVQVVDNRLNRTSVPAEIYLAWLNGYEFRQHKTACQLPFELVAAAEVDPSRPVLALLDADQSAFRTAERQLGLLALAGYQDPYPQLYQQLAGVVKQSLNVNPNEAGKYTVAQDFLTYAGPAIPAAPAPADDADAPLAGQMEASESDEARKARLKAAKQLKTLGIKLDVCLSELWLKWVLAGQATDADNHDSLPLLTALSAEWGFVANNQLLYFLAGHPHFADLDTPEGKQLLKARFTSYGKLKRQFMARQLRFANSQPGDEKVEAEFRKAHFVLIGQQALELEQTDTIAMPNWPIIEAIRAADAGASAKSLPALGVYAGGVWYNPLAQRYVVSGTESSKMSEPRGHHFYQIHSQGEVAPAQLNTLLALLTVTFVRRNQFTVWPYPFDLIRLHKDVDHSVSR